MDPHSSINPDSKMGGIFPINSWSQTQYYDDLNIHSGFCLSVVFDFASKCILNSEVDIPHMFEEYKQSADFKKIVENQKKYLSEFQTRATVPDVIAFFSELYNDSPKLEANFRCECSFNDSLDIVTKIQRAVKEVIKGYNFIVICIIVTATAKHVVAINVDTIESYIFDPTFGLYSIKNEKQFTDFFEDYVIRSKAQSIHFFSIS